MKKITLSILLSIGLLTASAQQYKNDIKKQFTDYYELIVKKEFAKATDYIMPEFFTIISKEQLVTVMETVFNNPELEIKIDAPNIDSVGDKKTIEGKEYAKLWYASNMKLKLNEAKDKMPDSSAMIKAFEQQFGEGTVSYDGTSGFYIIKAKKEAISASTDSKSWKFIEKDENQKELIKKILPKELIEE